MDLRALSKSLKLDSFSSNLEFGKISIKKEAVEVSERLKELDMLQAYLCGQVSSIKDSKTRDSLQQQISAATLEMFKVAQQQPDTSLRNKLNQVEQKLDETRKDIEEQKTIITTISIGVRLKLSADWGVSYPPYMSMLSSVDNFKGIVLADSTSKVSATHFYLSEYYFSKIDSVTIQYYSRQSVKDGAPILGKPASELQKYNFIGIIVPFLDWKLKIPTVDIHNLEMELFINGKSFKKFNIEDRMKVKLYNDNFHSWVEEIILGSF